MFVCKEFIDQTMKALYMHRTACKWVVQFTPYSISNNQNTNQCYCNASIQCRSFLSHVFLWLWSAGGGYHACECG